MLRAASLSDGAAERVNGMAEPATPATPKAFISYSWTSPTHQAWVIQLATRLRQDGVETILDKWHLQPGHDAIAFMERMVIDPEVRKVLLICDARYTEKANGRSGGVGTESQIISPEIYSKAAQDKFVAVISQVDEEGRPYLPVFYKGRVYIDLSDEERFEPQYEELLRWALDRPSLVASPVGSVPVHISSDQVAQPASASSFLRAKKAVEDGSPAAGGLIRSFSDLLPETLEAFRMPPDPRKADRDEDVISAIANARPVVKQLGELATSVARYDHAARQGDLLLDCLEHFAQKMYRPENVNSWNDWDYDNYKFSANEAFLVVLSAFIKEGRFDLLKSAFDRVYLVRGDSESGLKANGFSVFSQRLKSLEGRKARLRLNRLSLHADMLKEAYENHKPGFTDLMQADFVAFIRGWINLPADEWPDWWPTTLVFAAHRYHSFDVFARAESKEFAKRLLPVFHLNTTDELKSALTSLSNNHHLPRFDYHSIGVRNLANVDNIAKRA